MVGDVEKKREERRIEVGIGKEGRHGSENSFPLLTIDCGSSAAAG